jgi:hypothetical protein
VDQARATGQGRMHLQGRPDQVVRPCLCDAPGFFNPNCRSTLLTVVKSRSTGVFTSKTSPTNPNDPIDQVDTHVGSTLGQSHGQTPPKP